MAAFAQSLGQTLGQAGNDYGRAVDANLGTALDVIKSKLMNQEIQQRLREGDQRMAEYALRMKQMQTPITSGTFQTPQGIFVAQTDPNTGKVSGSILPGSQQLYAAPAELSDQSIDKFVEGLPKEYNKDEFGSTLKGFRGQGMYKEAFALMAAASKGIRPSASAQSLQQAELWAQELGFIPGTQEYYDKVTELWKPQLAPGTAFSTDPSSGLTTHSGHQKGMPNAPRGTVAGTPPLRTGPPRTPPVPPQTPSALPQTPSVTPPQTTAQADTSGIPWRGVGFYSPADIKKMAENWQNFGVKPEGKIEGIVQQQMARHGMAPGEKGKGTLTPQAERIILATDPVIKQIDELRGDIEKLGLQNNNQRLYLLQPYLNYLSGSRAPVNTLGDHIAGFSLGSVIEATSALQGGSRALEALRWARTHTPNVWTDSPSQMYGKLQEIRDRLEFIVNDSKTLGQKGLRMNEPTTTDPSGITTITPEDMQNYMKQREQKK